MFNIKANKFACMARAQYAHRCYHKIFHHNIFLSIFVGLFARGNVQIKVVDLK